MYISCPNCATKFVIKPEQIGIDGRYVRCSKCGYSWHASEDDLLGNHINKAYVPVKGVNLPAIIPNKEHKNEKSSLLNFIIIVFCLLMMASLLYFKNLWDQNRKLKIENIVISKNLDDTLIVRYKIKHKNLEAFKLPLIRVRLFDKNFKLLDSHVTKEMFGRKINDGDVTIKTEFFHAPKGSQYIDITLGGYFDFLF